MFTERQLKFYNYKIPGNIYVKFFDNMNENSKKN